MRIVATLAMLFSILTEVIAQTEPVKKVMDGFPPSRESQVTLRNYREYPYSQWSFRNIGGPMHMLVLPRGGSIHRYNTASRSMVATLPIEDSAATKRFEDVFKDNYASGVIVLQNNTLLYEQYWNGLSRDHHHVWFSMTKSMASAAL
jgi:hypothetical protein